MRVDSPVTKWLIVGLCFLSQNLSIGFAFGSFGPLLAATESHFGVSRAGASMGMSLINLALGGLAPFLGGLMQRIPVRYAMALGAVLSAVGYFGLATITVYPIGLVMFVLVGTGMSLTGVIGPLTMISRWFTTGRATILSIVNLPVALLTTPYLVGELLPQFGRSLILMWAAAFFLVLVPLLLLFLRDYPSQTLRTGNGVTNAASPADAGVAAPMSSGDILRSRPFWLVSIAIGIMAGCGIVFVVHIVPFGVGQGMTIQTASKLLSVHAASGLIGVLIVGRLADRIGAPQVLVLTSLCQMLLFCALLMVKGTSLYLVAALMGMSAVPMMTLHGAALGALVPVSSISRAIGLSYAIKLPFLFAFAPLAALLFETSRSYALPFASCAAALALSCLLFVMIVFEAGRRNRATPAMT